jgi:hypothetical protein
MRSTAALTILSNELSTALISQLFGLKPYRTYDVGDAVDPKRYPGGPAHKNSLWSIGSDLPESASLDAQLRALTALFDTKREGLLSIRGQSRQRFFCGLFGGNERTSHFEIPHDVIRWCGDFLSIDLDCYSCIDNLDDEVFDLSEDSLDDEPEPDRAFAYLARVQSDELPMVWPHETNKTPSGELLPRPSIRPRSVIASDLPEEAEVSSHIERVVRLARTEKRSVAKNQKLRCLFSTDRTAGSVITLSSGVLAQLAQLGASFQLNLYQRPPMLRRLRQLS